MKRIAILSDLHGNSAATEIVLAAIDAAAPDAVYCLGDLVGYGAFPNETIEMIRDRNIPTIMGNYDDGVGFDRDDCGCAYRNAADQERGQQSLMWTRARVTNANKAFLRTLASELRFEAEGVRVRLVHGSPRRMNEYLYEDRDPRSLERIAAGAESNLLVFGHTHIPWHNEIAGVWMVNTGSVGKPKDGDPRAAWVLITLSEDNPIEIEVHRESYDITAMATAIRAADGLPNQFARDLETAGAPPVRSLDGKEA